MRRRVRRLVITHTRNSSTSLGVKFSYEQPRSQVLSPNRRSVGMCRREPWQRGWAIPHLFERMFGLAGKTIGIVI